MLVAVLIMALVAACGSDDNDPTNTTAAGTAPTEEASPATDPADPTATSPSATDATATVAESTATSASQASPTGEQSSGDPVTLTVYTGQHEELVGALAEAFTAETGIELEIRAGSDGDLVNQIIEEGDKTNADLFLSEEPGPIGMLDKEGVLAPVDQTTLAGVDSRLVPMSGNWMPYAARSRVIYYNPDLIAEEDLPDSIMDLANPEWKGKFAYAPSGAFVGTVSYLINTIGEDATLTWLKAIQENGINEQSNGKVRDTVEAGQHPFGLSNHYYWWRLAQSEGGPDQLTSKIHYFDHADAGSLIMASGAAILTTSDHQDEAQAFLAWLGSATGGQLIVGGDDADLYGAQYPVAPGVVSQLGLPQISDLITPEVDQSVFSDTDRARELLIEAGIS